MTIAAPPAALRSAIRKFVDHLADIGRDSDKISTAVADELDRLAHLVSPEFGFAEALRMYAEAVREHLGPRHPSLAFLQVYGAPPKAASREATIAVRIPVFLARIASYGKDPDPHRVRGLVMLEQRTLKEHYRLNYVRVAFTRYRAAAIELLGVGHPVVPMLHAANNDMEAIKAVERRLVFEQHSQLRPIDPEFFIEKAVSLLYTERYYPTYAGLLLVTGRRPAEIGYSATFEQIRDREDALIFGGQLKGRESPNAQTEPYEIPILADVDAVLAAFDYVRSYRTFESAEEVNKKCGKEINTAVRTAFANFDEQNGYQPKELRAIYAEIAYDGFDDRSVSKVAYFARILGHATGDIVTALSYMKFYILGHFHEAVRDYGDSQVAMMAALEARKETTEDRTGQKAIEADVRRVATSQGVAPAPRPGERPAADLLTEHQAELLLEVVRGKVLFERRERTTVEALKRRGLVTITIDETERFAPERLAITSAGAEIAARLSLGR